MSRIFDYALRNLGRRRARTLLTCVSSALVAALLVATTAFVRGLETTFSGAAQTDVALLLSKASERDVIRSTARAGLGALVAASVPGVQVASDEIHMATSLGVGSPDDLAAGFVRGTTPKAYQVHDALTLVAGRLPGPGELITGSLVARQLGVDEAQLALGEELWLEGTPHRIVGHFVAPGTTLEAEVWTPLEPLRGLAQREDSSVVFVRLSGKEAYKHLKLFCDRRLDLELDLVRSEEYYAELVAYFVPIRTMAWTLAAMIALAALFGGANTAAAAVQDRIRELATLRAIGYGSGSILLSLLVENLLLASAGALIGLLLARVLLAEGAVRLAMSAFTLEVDAHAVSVGFLGTLVLGVVGLVPAALRILRLPIASALTED